jgi:hypothetical protein
MTRSVGGILGAVAIIVALGGCGGGGMEEGMPKDLTPGIPLSDVPMPLGKPGSNKPPAQPKAEAPPTAPAADPK